MFGSFVCCVVGVSHLRIGEAQNPGPPRRNHSLDDPEADLENDDPGRGHDQLTAVAAGVENWGPTTPCTNMHTCQLDELTG